MKLRSEGLLSKRLLAFLLDICGPHFLYHVKLITLTTDIGEKIQNNLGTQAFEKKSLSKQNTF